MKQKDYALIAIIIILSGVISLVFSNIFLGSPKKRQEKVEVVDTIQADFSTPDAKYFNANSLNETKVIKIGESPNTNPFNDKN